MLRKCFCIAILIAAVVLPANTLAGNKNGLLSPLITNDFVNIRKGPGTNWPLLAVIPPSTAVNVNFCSTRWSVGWCEVTYEGQTGFINSAFLHVRRSQSLQTSQTKPTFLIQAEEQYRQAGQALKTAEKNLNRLRQEEARLSQISLAKTGSWIEPGALWHQKLAAEQNLAFARELERQARARLDNAEDEARSTQEAKWSNAHKPSLSSWWQW
jgi:SH3-like domain-containing protein